MATKTISLELDAYEKLKEAKKAGESFSQVVRRAHFTDRPVTGNDLRAYFKSGGSKVSAAYLDAIEEATQQDTLPENPWD
jgi:predicted CopG family antitoxin